MQAASMLRFRFDGVLQAPGLLQLNWINQNFEDVCRQSGHIANVSSALVGFLPFSYHVPVSFDHLKCALHLR